MTVKLHLIHLGCPKNRIDTENILFKLMKQNLTMVELPEQADAIIINTCGFIGDSKEEAIDQILDSAEWKNDGNLKFLGVTGCLVNRYKDSLKEELPEVDRFFTIAEQPGIPEAVCNFFQLDSKEDHSEFHRTLTTFPYAYLKIAEGCNNCCSYCTIPMIRGNFQSRSFKEIIGEAEELAKMGIKEIIPVAQELTLFGSDSSSKMSVQKLLSEISQINGIEWIRLLYLYPDHLDKKLLEFCAENSKILPYFDIPIQHASDSILQKMNRLSTQKSISECISNIRSIMPDAALRTTCIVGFPGETDKDFNTLLDFIREKRFTRLGGFAYSREEGTPAHDMTPQIEDKVKEKRLDKLLSVQQKISSEILAKFVGKKLDILVEEVFPDCIVGRSYLDAPEIDGHVVINCDPEKLGEIPPFIKCKITESDEYDLYGKIISDS